MRANCRHLSDFGLLLLSLKITQRRFVITDVSGQCISPSWRVKLDPWRWDRQFVPKRRQLPTTMLRNIPEERRSHLYIWKYHIFYSVGLFINEIHFKILTFSFLNTSVKQQKELLPWLNHSEGTVSDIVRIDIYNVFPIIKSSKTDRLWLYRALRCSVLLVHAYLASWQIDGQKISLGGLDFA